MLNDFNNSNNIMKCAWNVR